MDTLERVYEEINVPASGLAATVKNVLQQGSVRRIVIRDQSGNTLMEIPLSVTTASAIAAPVLVAVGAIATALPHFTVVVERTDRRLRAASASTSHLGATEDQMNTQQTVGQRIDKRGTKIEDLAGTGEHDTQGG